MTRLDIFIFIIKKKPAMVPGVGAEISHICRDFAYLQKNYISVHSDHKNLKFYFMLIDIMYNDVTERIYNGGINPRSSSSVRGVVLHVSHASS